ncbi:unnamed protein product, partial [Dovyalis caffra]
DVPLANELLNGNKSVGLPKHALTLIIACQEVEQDHASWDYKSTRYKTTWQLKLQQQD